MAKAAHEALAHVVDLIAPSMNLLRLKPYGKGSSRASNHHTLPKV